MGNHLKMKFDYFQIQKWMSQTVRAENVDEKCIFFEILCWPQQKKTSLLKQFIYMHLKVLITLFQKMVWFMGVSATVHDILMIRISKKMLTQQKYNKFMPFKGYFKKECVSHQTGSHQTHQTIAFKPFWMKISCILPSQCLLSYHILVIYFFLEEHVYRIVLTKIFLFVRLTLFLRPQHVLVLFFRFEDKVPINLRPNVVYKFSYGRCNATY